MNEEQVDRLNQPQMIFKCGKMKLYFEGEEKRLQLIIMTLMRRQFSFAGIFIFSSLTVLLLAEEAAVLVVWLLRGNEKRKLKRKFVRRKFNFFLLNYGIK
jgi:hypothetical protein